MSILQTILDHKRTTEVPARRAAVPLADVRRAAEAAPPARDFAAALRRSDGRVALIAEVKRASPSRGVLARGAWAPADLARRYEANGASCVSVLTDERFFMGSLEDLRAVRGAIGLPVLRKDFVVDAYQLYEARAAGADAALLIVAALEDQALCDLHALARELALTALVEVHDEAEAERARKAGAGVIGVNNRDLRTFTLDLETTRRCAAQLRGVPGLTLVSESGIFAPAQVAAVAGMGAHAILVGEALITAGDLATQTRALADVPRAG
ncbi:MAG: indole-3-glycerol phosphate synthase TrpC [Thermoflexales bacterium]|nr:indole-3-glycerol phosphate synthase TrpC [Thermoflexales bacterium]